jgi:enoyl-CoA hydratase
MSRPWVSVDVRDGLAVLTLENPARRNAIHVQLADDLVEACDRVDADPAVGAVVIRGSDGYFCAGGDRDELAAICADPTSATNLDLTSRIYAAFLRVGSLRPLTIAAIRGGALGAGLNLALAADVRVVADDARIASGFTRLGVHPGGGHFHLLSRLVGPQAAAALGLAGQTIDGQRAYELGLAWVACPDSEVEEQAVALGAHAAGDPELARAAKSSLVTESRPPGISWEAAVGLERAPQMWSFARKGTEGWRVAERPMGA